MPTYLFTSTRRPAAGFTLIEALLGLAIGSMLLAAILSTYIYCSKAYQAVSNYRQIHAYGRRAVDWFARDVRGVSSITTLSTNSNTSTLVIVIPTAFSSSGTVTASKTVTYTCYGCNNTIGSGYLYRSDTHTSNTTMLATNICNLTISLYDHVGSNTTLLSIAKGIQIDIKLRRRVISTIQSEDYLSARLDMRNK